MLRFKVPGVPIAVINKLRSMGVKRIKTDGECISFVVPILYADAVKRLLRNYDFTYTENHNFVRGVNYLLNHFVLIAAVLAAATAYLVADRFVYSVRVVGGSDELRQEINAFLTDNGIKKYVSKQKILQNDIADLIVSAHPTVAHANIKIRGSTAVITVAAAEYNTVKTPQNLYAKYDAVIKQIFVSGGLPRVAVGDVVRAGDLLVENAYPDKVVIMGEVRFNTFVFDMNIV